jgi:hypothetical protein
LIGRLHFIRRLKERGMATILISHKLDLLASADRQRRHAGVVLQSGAEVPRHAVELRPQRLEIQNPAAQFRPAKNQILFYRERFDQFEVLMNERNAGLLGVGRRPAPASRAATSTGGRARTSPGKHIGTFHTSESMTNLAARTPFCNSTNAFNVGLPRESRISIAPSDAILSSIYYPGIIAADSKTQPRGEQLVPWPSDIP